MLRHLLISSFLLLSSCPSTTKDTGTWDDDGDGFSESQGDCGDADPAIHPGAPESCDGIDNDCDNEADEDPIDAPIWYLDADGDAFGNSGMTLTACATPLGYVSDATDCDDLDATAFPGARETCDGADDDCDGATDNDATDAPTWYADSDADGYGDSAAPTTACEAPAGSVSDATDCDDASATVHPGATELCNGIDDDCDSLVDDDDPGIADQLTWYLDADGDGYGLEAVEACIAPADGISVGGDCEDTDGTIHPGAPETDCTDPVDYNCDGSTGYADMDGDGQAACVDCDDSAADVNPAADEICDGIDNDCDGSADIDAIDTPAWYLDADGDGFGTAAMTFIACVAPSGTVANAADCDDLMGAIHPLASELCDGLDNDCDGVVSADEADADGDRWRSCDGDCDDSDPFIDPSTTETWYDGIDADCDGRNDFDADGDGFDSDAWGGLDCDDDDPTLIPDDNDGDGFSTCQADCDDADPANWPGAPTDHKGIAMTCIGHGSFTMGSPEDEVGRGLEEYQHEVTLTHAVLIGATEVTQAQFLAKMAYNPSNHTSCDDCPVEEVNWHEAATFANAVSSTAGLLPCYACSGSGPSVTCDLDPAWANPYDCPGYRLPTEAEWEYTARAGSTEAFTNGEGLASEDWYSYTSPIILDGGGHLDDFAWYCGNSGNTTHTVAGLAPNAWGLHDMSGNVYEWVGDWYELYRTVAITDPYGPDTGSLRVIRGGGSRAGPEWDIPMYARMAYRTAITPDSHERAYSLRLARTY